MKIKDYVEKLSFEEKLEIISNFYQFEKNGQIGNCLLRQTARKIIKDLDMKLPGITHPIVYFNVMHQLAMDCFRAIAEIAIENAGEILPDHYFGPETNTPGSLWSK